MYKYWKYILICVVLSAVMLQACTFDDERIASTRVSMFIQPMNLLGNETTDGVVNIMRIMAFEQDGVCKFNRLYPASAGGTIEFLMTEGIYTFVFVANEPSSPFGELQSVVNISDLDNIAFDSSEFDSLKSQLPMMKTYQQVTVFADGSGIQVGSGEKVTLWKIALDRLAARVDLQMESKINFSGQFTGIKISNLPDKVPLTSGYTGTVTRGTENDREFAASDFTILSGSDLSADMVWGVRLERIIIPSNEFTPTTNQDNSAELNLYITDGVNRVFALSRNPENGGRLGNPKDYSIPRNTQLVCSGEVMIDVDFYIQAAPWTSNTNSWNVNGHLLRVSQSEATINHMNGARIYFWSNMENIFVDAEVEEINESGATIATHSTNEVFNSLVHMNEATPPRRFHLENYNYDTRGRDGYMDIIMENVSNDTSQPSSVGNRRYKILLKAKSPDGGELRKEIIIRTTASAQIMYWGPEGNNQYVGTFHRNGEKGERIITGQHWGWDWTATVDSDSDWIVLSTTPSFDPNVGTGDPGNAELYSVTDGSSAVEGRGRIYFRVGITGTRGAATAPRYGRIKVTGHAGGGDFISYLYVRQGETPDYLMRPGDRIEDQNGNAVTTINRTASAVQFPPFNLTAPEFKNGNVSIYYPVSPPAASNPSDYFTQYPSQAGALFMYTTSIKLKEHSVSEYNSHLRRGYMAGQPTIGWWSWNGIAPPNNNFFHVWDPPYWTGTGGMSADNEACPPGYKRPNAGPTDVRATNASLTDIAKSQMHISLLLAPVTGNLSEDENALTAKNILSGIYADGYMDRRPIHFGGGFYSVGEGTSRASYSGLLFFNPFNNASLFLPAPGRYIYNYEDATQADISLGERGNARYWTSSVADGTEVWSMFGNALGIGFTSENPLSGLPVRCVKE